MPASTDELIRHQRPWMSVRARRSLGALGGALGLAVMLWAVNALVFTDPGFVQRLTIRNNSGYDVHIAVGTASGDETLPLGTAIQHCTTSFESVLDQGATWFIRLGAQGVDTKPVAVTRADLAANDWIFTIPDSSVAQLVSAGAPSPPSQACIARP